MSAPKDTTSRASRQQADVDIAAVYARLQQEVVRTRRGGRDDLAGLRDVAERTWAVTAEQRLERRPGLMGAVSYPVKRLLRPLLRWYVEPLAIQQRTFNDAVLQLIDELTEREDSEANPLGLDPGELDEPDERKRRA